jgi:6-phosphofructokinase 2
MKNVCIKIVTLTVNPALDKSAHFKGLVAEQKLDVSNSVMMREEAELMFLKQLRLGGESIAVLRWWTYRRND